MMKIDTSQWEDFRVGDLFEKLDLKCNRQNFNKAFDLSLVQNAEFNLPLVNAKHGNNGIMYYGRESDWEYAEMTIDIVGDGAASTGDVYAQPQKTGVLYNAYLVKPLWNCKSEYILQYMACVIEKCVKSHFGYDNKCTWDKVKEEIIRLPVCQNSDPDWLYMESYMKLIMSESEKSLANLRKVSCENRRINISWWGEFRIGDLFEKLELKCKLQNFNKAFDVSSEKTDKFNLPLTNACHYNNGIQFYGKASDWDSAEMTIDIVSNGAIATGDVYAQPQRTGVLWDSYLIKCKYNIRSELVLHYIACVIEKCVKQFFSWSDKCTWEKVRDKCIKLPITETGEPDWSYMEFYMKEIMEKSEQRLICLSKSDCA